MDRRRFLRRAGLAGCAAGLGGLVVERIDVARADLATPESFASTIAQQPAQGQARVVWSADPASRTVALTFDDGPTEQFTARVLDLLAAHRVTATFFVIGALVDRHPDLVRRARDAGHELGNHSYDHVSAAKTGGPQVREAMARGAQAVEQVTGTRPRWYRPPRGEITSATMLAAQATSQEVALWSVVRDGADGGRRDDDAGGVRTHLLGAIHPGAVVDLHDGIGRSAWVGLPSDSLIARRSAELAVLPEVLTGWAAAGYRFATLSELIPK
jgi:peptidoglycan/xylan/chitin deacetylase (PgdA/CDA1 family)